MRRSGRQSRPFEISLAQRPERTRSQVRLRNREAEAKPRFHPSIIERMDPDGGDGFSSVRISAVARARLRQAEQANQFFRISSSGIGTRCASERGPEERGGPRGARRIAPRRVHASNYISTDALLPPRPLPPPIHAKPHQHSGRRDRGEKGHNSMDLDNRLISVARSLLFPPPLPPAESVPGGLSLR